MQPSWLAHTATLSTSFFMGDTFMGVSHPCQGCLLNRTKDMGGLTRSILFIIFTIGRMVATDVTTNLFELMDALCPPHIQSTGKAGDQLTVGKGGITFVSSLPPSLATNPPSPCSHWAWRASVTATSPPTHPHWGLQVVELSLLHQKVGPTMWQQG